MDAIFYFAITKVMNGYVVDIGTNKYICQTAGEALDLFNKEFTVYQISRVNQ